MRTLIANTLRGMRDRWSRRRVARETERSLGSLDTQTLHDLGLHRSEIGSVAWEASRRTEPTFARAARYYPF